MPVRPGRAPVALAHWITTKERFVMDKRKAALLAIVLLAIAGFFLFDLGQYLNLANLKAQQAALSAQVSANPLLVGGAFFFLYVAVTALSLPGAALMPLVAGALFGLLGGTVLVSFASTLGATLAMLISRFLLRDWVQAKFSQRLAAIDQGIEREGASYLFALRLVPVFPFFLINLAMGLTKLPARTYWWVSQLGMLPGTLVSAYIAVAVKAKVTLIEKHKMGGDCLNTGCVPSKALLRSAKLANEMKKAEKLG